MKNRQYLLFLILTALLLSSCRSTPVYKGDGIHCSGGVWSEITSSGGNPRTSTDNMMMDEIESWMGTPYAYGGESRSGVDCSAFTRAVYRVVNIEIPRTASQQAADAETVTPPNLQFGDLIFFNTSGSGISHVGIYIGNGFFAHASSSRGVVRESLATQYYAERIVSVGRFIE
ncbi:MAG: C40 family peptidase [Candidatus Aegiribacteria sp.]|nr:C40 family peptidase [Candidatus Aegiribacteria sp.]